MCWSRSQQLLFPINQIRRVEGCQFKSMPVSNGVRRAGLNTVSAKNATVVIDVVNLGVTFSAAHTVLGRVLCCLNIDAIGRAIGCAKKTRHTLLQPVLIALQNMYAAKPFLDSRPPQWPWAIGIVLHNGRLEHLHEGDAHSLGDGGNIPKNRHAALV